MKKKLHLKNIFNSRLECTNHTLFQTKTDKKAIPFGDAHTYIAYIREVTPPPPPPPLGEKRVAYASETSYLNLTFADVVNISGVILNLSTHSATKN